MSKHKELLEFLRDQIEEGVTISKRSHILGENTTHIRLIRETIGQKEENQGSYGQMTILDDRIITSDDFNNTPTKQVWLRFSDGVSAKDVVRLVHDAGLPIVGVAQETK